MGSQRSVVHPFGTVIDMATVTATVLIGSTHPNDVGVNAQLVVKLWEGDGPSWIAHSLDDTTFERRVRPESPDDIAADGCTLIKQLVREFGCDAVMVCALPGSTINRQLEVFGAELRDVDLHLLSAVGSRTYSRWNDEWMAEGILAPITPPSRSA